MKTTWRERNNITTIDIVFGIIIATCVLMLLGANLARPEIEQRVIYDQQIYVEPDGILVEYKGETYIY